MSHAIMNWVGARPNTRGETNILDDPGTWIVGAILLAVLAFLLVVGAQYASHGDARALAGVM